MKKLKALTLTFLLSFSLTACGSADNAGSDAKDNAGSSNETVSDNADNTDTKSDSDAEDESGSDMEYVKEKGTLVVGVTDFEPMDYTDENGDWIGFDADMAKAFAKSLGVTAEFIEIDWDNKIMELESKNIDVVWNGMTLTDEVTSAMECTNAYCNNAQVIVVPGK